MKGVEEFRNHLPDYPQWPPYHFIALAIISNAFGLITMVGFDILPQLGLSNPVIEILSPIFPLIGMGIIEIIAFGLVYQIWRQRDHWITTLQDRAYQHAFHYGMVGIPLVFSMFIHAYLPVFTLILPPTPGSPMWLLSTPVSTFFPWDNALLTGIRQVAGLTCIVWGGLIFRRAIQTFGVDYMTIVYLFYPDESEIQDHQIYSVLRHPTYHGIFVMFLGSIFWQFSGYSFIFFGMFTIGMLNHIRRVEEKELIQRFGDPYRQYQRQVPALIVRPRDLPAYVRFLLGRP